MDIHQNADTWIHTRQLLNADDAGGKIHASTSIILGDLDSHQALLEELLHERRVHLLGLVHFANLGYDDLLRELGDGLSHHRLYFGSMTDGRGRDGRNIHGRPLPPAGETRKWPCTSSTSQPGM